MGPDVSNRVVVGLVKGAGWQYMRTWLHSLRRSGYSNEVALLTVQCEPDLYEHCAAEGVRTFEIDPEELLIRRSEDLFATRHLPLSRVIKEFYSDRFTLVTDDAHGPYGQYGFAPLDDVRKWMQRRR